MRPISPVIIIASRMRRGSAFGSIAKVSMDARPMRRAGSSMASSREVEAMDYAELAVTTNFSFLRGASHPQEMVACADELGLAAIGIADRNSFAGVVRAYAEAKERKIQFLPGVRLVALDSFEALAYPTDRDAYGRLCRLLTNGNSKAR